MAARPGFLYRNLAAGLAPTGTSSSTHADFPWSNLNDPQPRNRARVAAVSAILVFDLGSSKSVDCWAFVSTSLPAAATIRVRASDADATVVSSLLLDTGVLSSVTDPEYNGNAVICFASTAARYWRADFASANNPIDIGLAPLGLLFRPAIGFDYGCQEGRIDLSIREVNEATGAEFAVSGPKKRTRLLTFGALGEADVRGLTSSIADMDRFAGAAGDALFVEDSDDAAIDRSRDSVWGSFREVGASLATRDHPDYWSRSFKIVERL